jgi:hypothetical protein
MRARSAVMTAGCTAQEYWFDFIPGTGKDLSHHQSLMAGSGARPTVYSVGEGSFSKATGRWGAKSDL